MPDYKGPKPKVRDYTTKEKLTTELIPRNPADKFARLVAIYEIDVERYAEAKDQHPELKEHLEEQVVLRAHALVEWAKYFQQEYTVPTGMPSDLPRTVGVSSAGTESERYAFTQRIPNPDFANMPA